MPDRIRYRKLPGHRRGFFRGSSVWLGPDHLLLVRSLRFREEYKRFQFRDIQAIVVAKEQRYHISTRSFLIAVLWLIGYVFAKFITIRNPFSDKPFGTDWPALFWVVGVLLFVVWVVVSWLFSCRCRVYTAVSRDELPSVYRVWTARKFLAQVEPLIRQAQGSIDGPWAREVENRYIGPAESVDSGLPGSLVSGKPLRRSRGLATDVLIASLFVDCLLNAFNLNSNARWVQVGNVLVTLAEMASAIAVMVLHYRGLIQSAMQRLGIATVAMLGFFLYAQQFQVAFLSRTRVTTKLPIPMQLPPNLLLREASAVVAGLLGVAGLVILLFSRDDEEKSQIIAPSA